jgi:putative transposase
MVDYRRTRIPGGTYFPTVTLRNRRSDFLVKYVDALKSAFGEARGKSAFTVDAIVVLPDHLHTIWTLRPDDHDFSGKWRSLKSRFTRSLIQKGASLKRDSRGEYDLWQRRFWEHLIRDENDVARHVDYIHYNPVKHGLADVSRILLRFIQATLLRCLTGFIRYQSMSIS